MLRLALVAALVLIAACSADSTCPASTPLDCGSNCCPSGFGFECATLNKCYPTAASAQAACGSAYLTCADTGGGGSGGGVCAYWSCGSSTQCAQVMGAPSGTQCQFAAGQTCEQWCAKYIPGNRSCH